MKMRDWIVPLAIISILSGRVVLAQEADSNGGDGGTYAGEVNGSDDSDSAKPNGGRAEAVMTNTGKFVGAVGGATAGFVVGAPFSPVGQAAFSAAGGSIGDMAGGAVGRNAGQALDRNAEENQRSGRGGENDPRYDPSTLWNN